MESFKNREDLIFLRAGREAVERMRQAQYVARRISPAALREDRRPDYDARAMRDGLGEDLGQITMIVTALADGLLALWTEEGGECPHGRGFDVDCPGETCETCGGFSRGIGQAPGAGCPTCDDEGVTPCRHDAIRPFLRLAMEVVEGRREADAEFERKIGEGWHP